MSTKKQIPTIGCDPEIFVYDGNKDVNVVSCGRFGGTKKSPIIIDTTIGLGILEDGVTLEFNINPAKSMTEFHANMKTAVKQLTGLIKKQGLIPNPVDTHRFDLETLNKFPQAMVFGCDPDFEAFKHGEERMPPMPDDLGGVRCAGHHIHYGVNWERTKTPVWALVKFMEAFGTLFDTYSTQHISERREWYGLPGLYRPKSYGFEWRSPARWVRGYFNGHNVKHNLVAECHTLLTGLLANEKRAFELHKIIDWREVDNVLRKAETSRTMKEFNSLRADLKDYREEVYELGASTIEEAQGEEPIDVRQVGNARGQPARYRMAVPAFDADDAPVPMQAAG